MTDDKENTIKWPCDTVRGRKEGYFEAKEGDGLLMSRPSSAGSTVGEQSVFTLRTQQGCANGTVVKMDEQLRIRYLTPRECFRLMGQKDDAIDRIMEVEPSKTALYKMAGNSIVVDVLEAIFKGIYIDGTFDPPKPKQTSLGAWE